MTERAFSVKMVGDEDGSIDSLDGVASRQIVSASFFVNFPCAIKSRRW